MAQHRRRKGNGRRGGPMCPTCGYRAIQDEVRGQCRPCVVSVKRYVTRLLEDQQYATHVFAVRMSRMTLVGEVKGEDEWRVKHKPGWRG